MSRLQPDTPLTVAQYWKPENEDEFAGDVMPFWDGERFHLFYLLDRHHHAEQGGLGGHQWAHTATLRAARTHRRAQRNLMVPRTASFTQP